MKYIEFTSCLKKNNLYVFSLRDIENLFPKEKIKTIKNNLNRWLEKKYLAKLKRDLYEFTEPGTSQIIPDVYIANRLYVPSYVSLETALSIYSIIPDVAMQVTSVTTRATRKFKNKYGAFFYRTCKREAFTGYRLMQYEGFKILIADMEKALVDFLYFRLRSGQPLNIEEERFEKIVLKKMRWPKVFSYAKLFNKKTLKTAKLLKDKKGC